MLSVEAEAFSGFKQKWALKLARALAAAFADASAAYRRPANFEAFAAHGGEDRCCPCHLPCCWRSACLACDCASPAHPLRSPLHGHGRCGCAC